jgi:predicted NBD/HSP70 family sugar kinase
MIRPTEKEIRHPTNIHDLIRLNVLNFLRTDSPTSRSELARGMHISLPTIMRIVDELIQNGLVRETGKKETSGGGRPRSLIEFDGTDSAVISVDLGYPNMYGILSDLAGNVQRDLSIPIQRNDPAENISRLKHLINNVLTSPYPIEKPIRGIALGLPGIIDSDNGIVLSTPDLGWQNYPLVQVLSENIPVPIFIDKDINLTTLGEFGFGVARNSENMVCIAIGNGIGSGIIINGKLYRGEHFTAGNIGWMRTNLNSPEKNYLLGDPLETFASGTALVNKAQQYHIEHQLPFPDTKFTAVDILNAADENSSWANEIIQEMVNHLSTIIAAIAVIVDPHTVVLGGRLSSSAHILAERIKENLDGQLPILPEIIPSNLGSKASVLGTVMLVFDGTFEKKIMNSIMTNPKTAFPV